MDLAKPTDERAFRDLVAPFRRELYAHCYRMCGSLTDADDLLQESMLRAWKGLDGFEGRASLRTWLYKVTTSACLDALDRKRPRLLPLDVVAGSTAAGIPVTDDDPSFLEPYPSAAGLDSSSPSSPEARYGAKQSVALALLVALQKLPPKQRAVLLLCDVLGFRPAECAELLELTFAAVNSALQRARDTLASPDAPVADEASADEATLIALQRYCEAWASADISLLVSLLRDDATLAMPPMSTWYIGADVIGAALGGSALSPQARGMYRLEATEANGAPAFAVYARDAATGEHRATAIHVLDVRDGKIAAIMAFLDPNLFPRFGLPITSVNRD